MAHPSDSGFLALHVLRLKGFADPDAVAAVSGLDRDEVEARLATLAGDGLVLHREGRVTGWALTPAGRAHHAEAARAELEVAGARAAVDDAYRRFLTINGDLLSLCTAWQLRTVDGLQVVNDHADEGYDAEVIGRLVGIHDRVRPVIADLRGCLARFDAYGRRLRDALEKVLAGEAEWFTRPVIDSYHTVWFELHEDLLATLGVERSSEVSH